MSKVKERMKFNRKTRERRENIFFKFNVKETVKEFRIKLL